MSITCPDCKGTGTYTGIHEVEPCQRCNGLKVIGPGAARDPKTIVEQADRITDFRPVGASIKGSMTRLEGLGRDPLVPRIKVGDIIHVFDASWVEAQVTHTWHDWKLQKQMVRADAPCDSFRIAYSMLNYNVSKNRWEYIKAGTPVDP